MRFRPPIPQGTNAALLAGALIATAAVAVALVAGARNDAAGPSPGSRQAALSRASADPLRAALAKTATASAPSPTPTQAPSPTPP
ncbi:MAG TPA: hypothetical protein VNN12_08405, partial [Dehalococcoidia bacterium]|nr:hypothetical protein [Dehalococcoidia bacterium]